LRAGGGDVSITACCSASFAFAEPARAAVAVVPLFGMAVASSLARALSFHLQRTHSDRAAISTGNIMTSKNTSNSSSTLALPTTPTELIERFRKAGGPSVTTTQPDFDQSGLDFLVVHASDDHGQRWIVRAPRRDDVVVATIGEARVLALVARHLPVAVPRWQVHDASSDAVVGYVRLPGTPVMELVDGAPRFAFDLQAPPATFINDFAHTLVGLQAIDVDEARAAGVTVAGDHGRGELRRQLDETRAALAPSAKTWATWQAIVDDDTMWSGPLVLSHGDLHPGHWLIDEHAHLLGVLDWTEAKVSSPAVDVAMFFGCCGEAALQQLLARLEALGMSTSQLATQARARWSLSPVHGAAWALRTGNEAVLAYTRASVAALDVDV
jgi:aminoglycoside phosphotransferase (APT) family kinase protein